MRRPGVELAKTGVDAWEAANQKQADAGLPGIDDGDTAESIGRKPPSRRR